MTFVTKKMFFLMKASLKTDILVCSAQARGHTPLDEKIGLIVQTWEQTAVIIVRH